MRAVPTATACRVGGQVMVAVKRRLKIILFFLCALGASVVLWVGVANSKFEIRNLCDDGRHSEFRIPSSEFSSSAGVYFVA